MKTNWLITLVLCLVATTTCVALANGQVPPKNAVCLKLTENGGHDFVLYGQNGLEIDLAEGLAHDRSYSLYIHNLNAIGFSATAVNVETVRFALPAPPKPSMNPKELEAAKDLVKAATLANNQLKNDALSKMVSALSQFIKINSDYTELYSIAFGEPVLSKAQRKIHELGISPGTNSEIDIFIDSMLPYLTQFDISKIPIPLNDNNQPMFTPQQISLLTSKFSNIQPLIDQTLHSLPNIKNEAKYTRLIAQDILNCPEYQPVTAFRTNADEVVLSLKIASNDREYNTAVTGPYTVNIRTYGGWSISGVTALTVSFLNDEEIYIQSTTVDDQPFNRIIREKDNGHLETVPMAYFQRRIIGDGWKPGYAFGLSVDDGRPRLYFSPNLTYSAGKIERLLLGVGVVVGQVKELSPKVDTGESYTGSGDPPTVDRLKFKPFLMLGYNW